MIIERLRSFYYGSILFYGWKRSLAATVAVMAVSLLLFGLFYPYWQFADQDLILGYQALLLNDGRTQQYFDHPGYLYVLLLAAWYQLCHWLGALPVHALSLLPPARDVVAFEAAWQHLVEAGRVLSLIIAGLFVWAFASLLRRLVGDWRIAAAAALALALSGSLMMHVRIMRTELLSAGLATMALLLTLLACGEYKSVWRPLWLGLAALCGTLAVVTKVQAIFPVLAIPAIALLFAHRPSDGEPRDHAGSWWMAGIVTVLALAAAAPALALFLKGFASSTAATAGYRPLGLPDGSYQLAIALWIVAAMVAHGIICRAALPDAVAAIAAVALGVSLGLLSLYIRFHEQNLLAVTHPIEHMYVYAGWSSPELDRQGQVLNETLFGDLLRGLGTALAAHTFVLHTSSRPTLMLEWLTIAGAVVLWRRGDRRLPLQVALMVVVVWGMDTVFTLRGLKLEYAIYGDPLLIIAAALVAARFPDLLSSPRAQTIGLAVIALSLVWSHIEPVKPLLTSRTPAETCEWLPIFLKEIGPFPFCRS